uniref:Uncharacterized protein n=1 Tax=Romanomermis culicivorax TaxID=13658 RepID=A0A915J452_ROMCU
MIATIEKLSKFTSPAAIAVNKNAPIMHRSTVLRASKRARCTRRVFTKTRTGAVSAGHHQS